MSLGFAHSSFPLHSLQKGLDFCGQWEEAITCYSKAINLDPQRAELYEQWAEAFLQLCDFQLAVLNFGKLLTLVRAWEQLCLAHLALVLDQQELYCEALEAFTQAAKLQPHRKVFCQRGIVCLVALNKFPVCPWKLNRDLEEDVKTPDLYMLCASFYKHFGQGDPLTAQGLQCSLRARVRELGASGGSEAQWQLALTYNCAVHCYTLGRFDEAVMLLGEALWDERREKGLCVNRGDCFLRLGELAYALADYQQALELSLGDRVVRRGVAAALQEQGWLGLKRNGCWPSQSLQGLTSRRMYERLNSS
ncbi:unnamed protein product [Bubo scandiacus]